MALAGAVALAERVPFLYRDFREGWTEGGRLYRQSGLYRQRYCGCLASARERDERLQARVRRELRGFARFGNFVHGEHRPGSDDRVQSRVWVRGRVPQPLVSGRQALGARADVV